MDHYIVPRFPGLHVLLKKQIFKREKTDDSPPTEDGRISSHIFMVPSEEADANMTSVSETIIPEMHVTLFLCGCGTCKTCLHCEKKIKENIQ